MAKSPRQPKNVAVSTQPGQISAPGGELTNYLLRNIPLWHNPQAYTGNQWRVFIASQPIAGLCRDAITNYLLSLDWAIVARDSTKQDEYQEEIDHYTRLFERGNTYYTSLDFTAHIEWIVKDLLDLPFGAAAEIGREGNAPKGKVVWIRPLDGATLAPTLDVDYPVVQQWPNLQPVVFPKENVSRIYLSPRTEIHREGWGMAPPEKIYLAMEMLNMGDRYYSQLLLNTPEAGILDLGDMDEQTATSWIKSFKDLMFGINALKIPVLYEHTSAAKWIPFGKLPSEIMYDNVTDRYITILTAGYGLSPSDIGFASSSNGGETLSGTIRSERRSAKSGKALAKKKVQYYFENILPEYLAFRWKDFDDEKAVSMSRARGATAQAFSSMIQEQIIEPDEARRQLIADGLFTITMPETLDRKSIDWPVRGLQYQGVKNAKGASDDKKKVNPSQGGQGDAIPQQIIQKSRSAIEVSIAKAVFQSNQVLGAWINSLKEKNDLPALERSFEDAVVGKSTADLFTETIIDDSYNSVLESLDGSVWVNDVSVELSRYLSGKITTIRRSIIEREAVKRAEQEFISEKREDIALSQDELGEIENVNFQVDPTEVKKSLLTGLIPMVLLISKNCIRNYKFPLDATDFTDHNNIKVAKEISGKVYEILPDIIKSTVENIERNLGEK